MVLLTEQLIILLIFQEARMAIEHIVIPKGEAVDLLPRSSSILSLQMDVVQKYQLEARKISRESDVHLRILPSHSKVDEDSETSDDPENDALDDFASPNGSPYSVDRLPLLPD